jgi:hypothetical protein
LGLRGYAIQPAQNAEQQTAMQFDKLGMQPTCPNVEQTAVLRSDEIVHGFILFVKKQRIVRHVIELPMFGFATAAYWGLYSPKARDWLL